MNKNLIPLSEVYQQSTNETIALDRNASGIVVSYTPHRSQEVHTGTEKRLIDI